MEPEFVRLKQLLKLVCLDRSTFYRLRKKLQIPFYKNEEKSRAVLYDPQEVTAIIRKYRRQDGDGGCGR